MNADELAAGTRTVVHLSSYFDELKLRVRELASRIAPQQRGYFTSNEQDSTRALLVSYWNARNALFELITSFRADTSLDDASRQRAFLTAFAAALLLVDAARTLRELADARPIVRRKLNEPAAEFGVPGGVYDRVQRSLISMRHGWHLYHAQRYFQEHRDELRHLPGEPHREQLMAIIDRLEHRLDVTLSQFGQARLRTRVDQISRQLARDLLGRALYGLQKVAGTLVADKYLRYGHRPSLPTEIGSRIQALLSPGDVLIVRKEYALTNYFLPGYWPHAALYLGPPEALTELRLHEQEHAKPRWADLLEAASDTRHCVLESMRDGVRFRTLTSPFASDSVVVLRPRASAESVFTALSRVMAHEGKAYDFDFDFRRADRLVCTEVVYRAYDGVGDIHIPLTWRAGRPTLSGSDLIRMGIRREAFDPVAVYAPRHGQGLIIGTGVAAILDAAEGARRGDEQRLTPDTRLG